MLTSNHVRRDQLEQILEGLRQTGVPLVRLQGDRLAPGGAGDDPGLFYFVPQIAHAFGLSIDQSLVLFFGGLTLIIAVTAAISFFFLCKTWLRRGIAWLALILLLVFMRLVGGGIAACFLYDLYALGPMAAIPLYLAIVSRSQTTAASRSLTEIAVHVGLGIGLGVLNVIRGHTGTFGLVFVLVLLAGRSRLAWPRKALFAVSLLAGAALPLAWFHTMLSHRDVYLARHIPGYSSPLRGHVFWHSVYVGMSFLDQGRKYNLAFDDQMAFDRVHAEHPEAGFWSSVSEATMWRAVVTLAQEHPLFVCSTVFAKFGVLIFYFLVFANVGLAAGWFYPKGWRIDIAFLATLAFSALPSIVLYPEPCFSLGFIAVATLYGVVSINHALAERASGQRQQTQKPDLRLQPLAA